MDFPDINRTRVETLFADLELTATFMTIAESSIGRKRERNFANARFAYLTVKDKLLRLCTPTDQERALIRQVLHDLERRLRELSNEV
jgi:hypothetical protein